MPSADLSPVAEPIRIGVMPFSLPAASNTRIGALALSTTAKGCLRLSLDAMIQSVRAASVSETSPSAAMSSIVFGLGLAAGFLAAVLTGCFASPAAAGAAALAATVVAGLAVETL